MYPCPIVHTVDSENIFVNPSFITVILYDLVGMIHLLLILIIINTLSSQNAIYYCRSTRARKCDTLFNGFICDFYSIEIQQILTL